jgi:hyperosmotically inducible periplasmic protein
MKIILALGLALALIACSEPPPPPKKAAAAPPPVAATPAPPKPEVKPEPPKPDPNKELAAKVKQTLEAPDSKLPSGAIDVTAADGRVSLWGAVATAAQRTRAAQIASKVEGVKGVDNQLKVVKGS